MYGMQLYDKCEVISALVHFLKHSNFGDMLILLFACSYISYVAVHFVRGRPKKVTQVSNLNFLRLSSRLFLT